MKRAALILGILAAVALAAPARAETATYNWSVDGPPFGPNVSASAGDYRIVIFGSGTLRTGDTSSITGGGTYAVIGPDLLPVASGEWRTTSLQSFVELGREFPDPLTQFRTGKAVAAVELDGFGQGVLELLCDVHEGEEELEGVRVNAAGISFDEIVHGSTTLERI